jgi:hypothetical protein
MAQSVGQETAAVIEPMPAAPVLAVGLGRGFGGKSTVLSELVWRARNQGRQVIVADGDTRSTTLAGLFPGEAMTPPSEELPDVKDWLSQVLIRMVQEQHSAVIDLGGGDRVLMEFGRDLRLVDFCEEQGIEPVAIYVLGPEEEDLRHVLSIHESGSFQTKRTLLVLNEGVIREGRTVRGAFDQTLNDPGFQRMIADGAVMLVMNRLAAMDKIKKLGCGFYDAMDHRKVQNLDPVAQFMTKTWLKGLEANRVAAGVQTWLP